MLSRFFRRWRKFGLWAHLRGLWLSRRFATHGLLVVTGWGPAPKVLNRGGRLEAENCQFYEGVRFELGPGAIIRIGNGTYLNHHTLVVAEKLVEIGRDCKIAWDVVIMDSDLHEVPGQGKNDRPVVIEDEVWIGCRAIVLKGVRVGKGAVIAAGAVVTKSVAPYSIVAGVPARFVRMRDDAVHFGATPTPAPESVDRRTDRSGEPRRN